MKSLRKILLVLISLFLISSLILWIFFKTVNPETIKAMVSNQITALTHKKTTITGAISWQIFPRPGLKFNKIQIGDKPSEDNYSLFVENMVFELKLTPLFKGDFIFSQLTVDGLKMQLNQDEPEPKQTAILVSHSSPSNQQFAIDKLVVKQGEIAINRHGHNVVFKDIQATAQAFNLHNQPFALQIKAKFLGRSPIPVSQGQINFKGRMGLSSNFLRQLPNSLADSTIDGQLLLQNVLINQYAIKKINTTVRTLKDKILFNPFTVSLYNGAAVGDLEYDFATQTLNLHQTGTNLDGKQLFTAFSGKNTMSGSLDYSIHASFPLKNMTIANTNGSGTITLKDGVIYNLNLDQLINHLKLKINNLLSDKKISAKLLQLIDWDKTQYTQGNTPFKLGSLQFQLKDGILSSESLLLQTDNLQVKGSGNLNLINHQLNAPLQAKITKNTDLSLLVTQQLLGGYFPLEASGTLEQPVVLPDFKIINSLHSLIGKTHLEKPILQIKDTLKELIH